MSTHPRSSDDYSAASGAAGSPLAGLPVTHSLTPAYIASFIIAIVAAAASVAGLSKGTSLYPTEEMLLLHLPTDLFTLVVGLPILLGSMWLARRCSLLGLLCWPGALLYLLYIYVGYAIGVPFGAMFLAYVTVVALGAYTTIGLVASIDAAAVGRLLAGAVPARPAGGILAGLSILFSLMNLAQVINALTGAAPDYSLKFPVWIADFAVLAPAWLVGGLLLWQRKPLGYVAGCGLLLVGSMLLAGAMLTVVFPVFYTGSPLDVAGIAFLLGTGLICLVPLGLYARGIVRSGRTLQPAQ